MKVVGRVGFSTIPSIGGLIMLSVKQAAARLGCSIGCIYSLCSAGKIEHVRIGCRRGTIRIAESALELFLANAVVEIKAGETAPPAKPSKAFANLNGDRLLAAWQRQGVRLPPKDGRSARSSAYPCDPSGRSSS